MSDILVEAKKVSKEYWLYFNPNYSLKQRVISMFNRDMKQRRESFWALRDVSFTLKRGESIALIGHNGSGKTTLMQILAGIMLPTRGRVVTNGSIAPLIALGVGFNMELTGRENIFLNASLLGNTNQQTERDMAEIIAFSELGEFIDVAVKNYSSGMLMRLGFSVAIHTDPDILLADEILAVGDPDFQQKCLSRVREMQANGMSIVLVTHSEDQARQFCQQYIKLDHGQVVDQGYFEPVSSTVAAS